MTPAASTADSDSGSLPVFHVSDLGDHQVARLREERATSGSPAADLTSVSSSPSSGPTTRSSVRTAAPKEYDEEGKTYTYTGGSGVALGNWFSRLLYSIKYAERNILLSSVINENSKILYNRDPGTA